MVKKMLSRIVLAVSLCLITSIAFMSCGGGGGGSSPTGLSTASVSGSWNLYLTKTGGTEKGPDFFVITQTGNSISGTAKIGLSVATITGTISGTNITLSFVFSGGQTTLLTGTISDDGITMSGTYSNSYDESGTWRSMPLTSISVTALNASIAVGTTTQFTAIGTYYDGTTNDVTSNFTWNSSNTSTATINNGGLATGVTPGTSTVTATLGSISGNTILTVTSTPALSDGLDDWHLRTSGTAVNLNAVTYGNGIFVAVGGEIERTGLGGNPTGTIMTSPDGVTWTQRYSGSDAFSEITYGNGIFVAVVMAGADVQNALGAIMTSPDGVTWTRRYLSHYVLLGVTYCNGTFVAVGGEGDFVYSSGAIITSPDGVTWTQRYSGVDIYITGVTYGNNLFVTVGGSLCPSGSCHYTPLILTSSDGISWTQNVSEVSRFNAVLSAVSYGNGTFVAVGVTNDGKGTILTATDGITTWTQRNSGSDAFTEVTYGNGTFVTVGNSGTILTSTDGSNWTLRNSGTTSSLNGIAYGDGTFVIVGYDGTIIQSDPVK